MGSYWVPSSNWLSNLFICRLNFYPTWLCLSTNICSAWLPTSSRAAHYFPTACSSPTIHPPAHPQCLLPPSALSPVPYIPLPEPLTPFLSPPEVPQPGVATVYIAEPRPVLQSQLSHLQALALHQLITANLLDSSTTV